MSSPGQLVGARSSDIATFTTLFEEKRALFYRIAYRAFQFSRTLAEDGVQDAYIRCLPHWGESCRLDNFQPYIARVIIRLSQDHFRDKSGVQPFTPLDVPDLRMSRLIERTETSIELHTLFRILSPKQRELFELAADYELSDHEYAQILSISTTAVKSRLRNGKNRIRGLFK